jgi:zinc transporter
MKVTTEFCYVLNGNGRAKPATLKSISHQTKEPVWVHIDYANEKNQEWLKKQKLSPAVVENLLDSDTTPRYFKERSGVLIVLRGVSAVANEEDDMIALHIWMTKNRLLTLSHRALPTISKIMDDFKRGKGPETIQDCFVELARQMNVRVEKTLVEINEEGDELEERIIGETSFREDTALRNRLSALRHKIVGLRRYLVPQREMMNKLCNETTMFDAENLQKLQELSRDLTAIVSELDFARDHSAVTQEELDSQTNIEMSQTMYLMSLIMVVFTPLTFITGLLGANVGGIPFGEHPYGFVVITLILIVIAVVQAVILKKVHWF